MQSRATTFGCFSTGRQVGCECQADGLHGVKACADEEEGKRRGDAADEDRARGIAGEDDEGRMA